MGACAAQMAGNGRAALRVITCGPDLALAAMIDSRFEEIR